MYLSASVIMPEIVLTPLFLPKNENLISRDKE